MEDILTFTTPETRWLSNMAFCEIEHEGIIYPSTENFYQAMKYKAGKTDFGYQKRYENVREHIATLTPQKAKAYSKANPATIELTDNYRLSVMVMATRLKYKKEPFRTLLLNTGDCHLEEGNWWNDKFFGTDIKTREGENYLGRILMMVRNEIRGELE